MKLHLSKSAFLEILSKALAEYKGEFRIDGKITDIKLEPSWAPDDDQVVLTVTEKIADW